ncbi:MAG: hypothetical protein GWP10_10570 [Nitrospiraceae bacterium]|nr:hypothetical protein [Nitrospiraceae bacterium]
MEFYVDDALAKTDYEMPFSWECDNAAPFTHTIKVVAYKRRDESLDNNVMLRMLFLHHRNCHVVSGIRGKIDGFFYMKCFPNILLYFFKHFAGRH